MQLVDGHCHVSPQHFPQAPSVEGKEFWPCMQCATEVKGTLHIGDKAFRELDERSWNVHRRIADMDKDGVMLQVLSPMPELLSYWLNTPDAEILCDHSNQQIAAMMAAYPHRFRGLGAITLQSPDKAYAQLLRLKNEFGFSGVEIGSNINGMLLGDKSLEPFYAAAESLNMAVFVHALHPVATSQLSVSPMYTALAGFPTDVGMAAVSIIMAGVLERYPRLRIAFSHGGGTLGAMLGRLDLGWQKTEGFGGTLALKPSEQVKRCFFDSNVYSTDYLRLLAGSVAPKRIFVGTDYPYAIQQEDPVSFIKSVQLGGADLQSLCSGAAMEFLSISGS